MTPTAILFLLLAVLIVWGGLVASIVFLARHGEVEAYPPGGDDLPGDRIDE